jgi:hypothetical protein
MNMNQVKEIAKDRGVKPGKMKKQDLIRTIQQVEGNPECFNTNFSQACGQDDCIWRPDCD